MLSSIYKYLPHAMSTDDKLLFLLNYRVALVRHIATLFITSKEYKKFQKEIRWVDGEMKSLRGRMFLYRQQPPCFDEPKE